MDIIILCGGKGTRLSEETSERPKPMVEIGNRPILWHIMKYYSHFGCNRFILALGYKGEYIKNYFYNYRILSSDFTLDMHPEKDPIIHDMGNESHWEIVFVDTGLNTLKGGRIKRVEQHVKSENFHVTYGDGLCDINIKDLENYHVSHKKTGTVTGVHPPSRFGEMSIEGDTVTHFEEKPQLSTGRINGGFFVFNRHLFEYLSTDEDCDFEFGPLQKIARAGELKVRKHDGFWQCMDTVRERDYLNNLWHSDDSPWKIWD
ncbi:MAG: glucose-1-phosphate cytidylyltransferase [Candidatus Brocadiaceae bacterium]|nr:glucose-1-phosphate cytidylyltransferase [Candidatus Brocadiaceae bacterium]